MNKDSRKFCMITTFYPPYNFGGDGIYVYRLSNELARRGHYIDVIHCVDAYQLLQKKKIQGDYPNHPNIKLYPLKSSSAFLSSLCTQQTGIPFFRRTIKRILEQNSYNVIHYHNMSLIGISALGYGNAVKLYTMHEHWLVCPMHVLWKYNREVCKKRSCLTCTIRAKRPPQLWRYTGLLQKMLKHVDGFISPSRFTKDKHLELGLNIPVRHIPNFLPQNKEPLNTIQRGKVDQDNRPYFLFVGRLEKIKGLQNLIPVFRKRKEYVLLVAGEGEYEGALQKLSENDHNIIFLGRLNNERLRELYHGAVAAIVPSICYEVFGVIIIESFAMKTPVIANNLGALPEVIEGSRAGFLYSNDDELIHTMDKLASDPGLRKRLGMRGYQAYLKYWSEDSHIREYFNLIEELQKKRHSKKVS